ncbi:2Fe-2S iron-sulfur cluster binding domain-containing protein [Paenibacillus sp. LMG 31456]|uniref:2Fe-2S iron-sulfur cluster binding domain-containing protein n=1 Tax=Paenibacillus foliorum TaxID=2654974 RepID=A0A972GSJ0_9BACL|nr:(2Fe-2S)-binding protein [Paenibacillus foliorum]NOU91965.1 2Fe-2S iron-sulfur cluster binding domain-containing protein [Paenibacillus foliorum]
MSSCDTALYPVEIDVNGEKRTIQVRGADILLHILRDKLGLTGSKSGCNNGDCGTCTILVNRQPIKSCLMLTVEADGKQITTIEGVTNSPVQNAFVHNQAFQCGYCTPGFIVNCEGLWNAHPHADEETIRVWLESNICRCMSYEEIHHAVKDVFTPI